jgi:uncharacterized metal-binding protein YceD (DUF177 family)
MTIDPVSEFSRRVLLSQIGHRPYRQEIAANADERAALASRFGLVSVERLSAQVELTLKGRDLVLLHASFEAEFAQQCVVTLDPVPGAVSAAFELLYGPAEAEETIGGSAEDDIAFEPLSGDTIDIGEAVAQEFSLSLPEFPRAPGADLEAEMPPAPEEGSPFAALRRLRQDEKR